MKTQYNIRHSQKHIIKYLAQYEDTNNPGVLVFKANLLNGESQDMLLNSSSLIEYLMKKLTHLDHEKLKEELEKCTAKYLAVQKMEEKLQIDEETKDSFIYKIENISNQKLFQQKFDEIIQQHESALSLPGMEHPVQNFINYKLTNEVLQPILEGERFFKVLEPLGKSFFLKPTAIKSVASKLVPLIPTSNLEVQNHWGETPLILTAFKGQTELLDEMLKFNPQPNVHAVSESRKTALHRAVEGQDQTLAMQCCTLLMKAGVNMIAKDKYGKTPLDYAKTPEMILFLETNGSKPGDQVADGEFAAAPMGEI
jgi:hypothetical protein